MMGKAPFTNSWQYTMKILAIRGCGIPVDSPDSPGCMKRAQRKAAGCVLHYPIILESHP